MARVVAGKSTIVTLLASEARARGYQVLVVDSDESNSGLFRMLGFDQPPIPLMELVGSKKSLKQWMSQPNVLAETAIPIEHIPPPHLLKQDSQKTGEELRKRGKVILEQHRTTEANFNKDEA